MGNSWFEFRQFRINQPANVFRVGTDGVLLGAWAGEGTSGARKILDVGTGTGLIALMMAQRFPKASVTAIEPDNESYLTAVQNISDSKWSSRINVLNLSYADFGATEPGKFDIIVTNPPFFRSALPNPDPVKAAFRHVDTLTFEMISEITMHLLDSKGRLCVVLPWAEGNVFVAVAAIKGLYCSGMLKVRPLLMSRFNRVLMEFTAERQTPAVKILTIGHPSMGGYTMEYKTLTGSFYLNL